MALLEQTREPAAPQLPRKWLRVLAGILGALLLLMAVASIYLSSDSFKNKVRKKVVTELERVTGGRVELKNLTWQLGKLEFEARDLTIHGNEAPNEIPYAHIDLLKVRLKIFSVMQQEVGLSFLAAQGPVLHIIVNPDGTTNQPVPKVKKEGGKDPIDVLFELQIDQLEVTNGMMIWNDRKTPFELNAEEVSAGLNFVFADSSYDGHISIATSTAQYAGFRPLHPRAELKFNLAKGGAQIKSFTLSTPRSSLQASGKLVNLHEPNIELDYKASLDLAEFAAVARFAGVNRGHADVQGSGKASLSGFDSTGNINIRGLAWNTAAAHLQDVALSSKFTLDQDHLSLPNINARALGGSARGQAKVANWTTFDLHVPAEKLQRGTANLELQGVSVEQAASAFTSASLQLRRLNARGTANGTVKLAWTGSPARSTADLALDIAPPANLRPGELPLSARLRGRYNSASQQLTISQLDLATPGTTINASGDLGSEDGTLRLRLEARDLKELSAILPDSSKLPVEIKGKAKFDGVVRGRLTAPSLAGRLEVTDFDSIFALPAAAGAPGAAAANVTAPKRVHWDRLSMDLVYSPAMVNIRNGQLERGSARIAFSGNASLRKGKLDENKPFALNADLRNASVADVQNLAGVDYPITGTANLRMNLSGTPKAMAGDGRIEIANGTLYGEAFRTLTSNLRFRGKELQLNEIALAQNGNRLTGNAAYNLENKHFRFDARTNGFDLAHLQLLQKQKVSVKGSMDLAMSGTGTVERPVVNARLTIHDMVVNGEAAGDLTATAVTEGRELKIDARTEAKGTRLTASGTVMLERDFNANLDLKLTAFDLDPLLRTYLENRVTGHSSVDGTFHLAGPMKDWKRMTLKGEVTSLSAEVERIPLKNDGPLLFAMADQVLTLQQFHIKGEGTDINASGTVSMAGSRALDLKADGTANLKLFQSFGPDLMTYGRATMNMTVGGTAAKPALRGRVTVKDAGVSFLDLPNGLSEINGTLIFNENRLLIQTLTAKSGGGKLDVKGSIYYREGLEFDLTATGNDIRLRYPPGISAGADATLHYSGNAKSSLLSGDIVVTRFGLNPRFDFALYLARSKQPPTVPKANPMLDNLRLDVHVVSTPELQVQTSLAKITGDADLRLRGTASRPAVLGRINIVEGDVFFNSTKYRLERGDILFTNPVRIEPVLNIEASARVREYDITLGFHGTPDKLSTTYRSEPPLPTADIIALLALGRTREDAAINQQPNQSFTDTASNAILGQALNAAISNRVQKLFGVSRIKIDPQVGGAENPNARLTIEQQVNNNITLTYITNLSQSAQQVIQAEFNFNKNVSLVVVRDQNGVLGFDVRVRQRKK